MYKSLKYLLISSPIILAVTGITVYYSVHKNKENIPESTSSAEDNYQTHNSKTKKETEKEQGGKGRGKIEEKGISKGKEVKEVRTKEEPIEGDFFPNVTFDEIYDDIRIKNEEPIITEDMISKFIKIIFLRLKTTKGKVNVKIYRKNNQEVSIKFTLTDEGKVLENRIYTIKLKY